MLSISCPPDTSIISKFQNKINTYGLLIRNVQILYPDYQFQLIRIMVDALCYRPKCLNSYTYDLFFNDKEIKTHVDKMRCLISNCIVKICN